MNGVDHVAAADCERCRPGAIAQPVNTISSLAFTAAGFELVARQHRNEPGCENRDASAERALGWAAVTAGLGSVAYHGPGTRAGQILHDASLLTMLAALIVADTARSTRQPPPRALLGALPVVATTLAASRWSLGAQVATGIGAAVAEIARVRGDRARGHRGWRPYGETVVATVGALGHVLGRSGGPLCRPESKWQAHAAWHTAMSVVLVVRD